MKARVEGAAEEWWRWGMWCSSPLGAQGEFGRRTGGRNRPRQVLKSNGSYRRDVACRPRVRSAQRVANAQRQVRRMCAVVPLPNIEG